MLSLKGERVERLRAAIRSIGIGGPEFPQCEHPWDIRWEAVEGGAPRPPKSDGLGQSRPLAEPGQRGGIALHDTDSWVTRELRSTFGETKGSYCGTLYRFRVADGLRRSDQRDVPSEEIGVKVD